MRCTILWVVSLCALFGCASHEPSAISTAGPAGSASDIDDEPDDEDEQRPVLRPRVGGDGDGDGDGDDEPAGDGGSIRTGIPNGTGGSGGEDSGGSGGGGGSSGVGGADDAGASSELDPDAIYLAGTLSEGACYLDAIALVGSPNVARVGFDCYFDNRLAVVHPTEHTLLYTNTFEDVLREFRCDEPCTWDEPSDYPSEPLRNDPILPTLPCNPDDNRLVSFLVGPDGMRIHACLDGNWYDVDGEVIYDGDRELAYLGAGGIAFANTHVVDLATGDELAIPDLPAREVLAIRARDSGFWLALESPTLNDTPELWEVGSDGVATMVGAYPLQPEGQSIRYGAQLDPTGALYQISSSTDVVFEDTIVRRTLDGDSEVIYTEADMPLVMIHISDLVTGP